MKRLQALKRQLIIEGAIALGLVLLFAEIYAQVDTMEEDEATNLKRLTAKINQANSRISTTETELQKSREILKLYQQLSQRQESDFRISRPMMIKKLEAIYPDYLIQDLQLTMTPIENVRDEKLKATGMSTVQTQVTINFIGLTDGIVFSFIEALTDSLPGYTRIEYLGLKKISEIGQPELTALERGALPRLTMGRLIFSWYGLEPKTGDTPQ